MIQRENWGGQTGTLTGLLQWVDEPVLFGTGERVMAAGLRDDFGPGTIDASRILSITVMT
jgi:hypothetical protein